MLFFNSWFSFLFTSITFVLILDVNFLCICLLRFYDVFFITLFYESLKMYISFIFNNYIKPYLHFPTFRLGCLSHVYKTIKANKCESGLKIIYCVCIFDTVLFFVLRACKKWCKKKCILVVFGKLFWKCDMGTFFLYFFLF